MDHYSRTEKKSQKKFVCEKIALDNGEKIAHNRDIKQTKEVTSIMATNLTPRISPTSVSDLGCAKRFHVLRVLKQYPERDPLSWASFGTAFHAVIGRVYDPKARNAMPTGAASQEGTTAQAGGPPNLDTLEEWSRQAFRKHRYADTTAREEDRARCVRMICGYLGQEDEEDGPATIAVEQFIQFTIEYQKKPLFILSGRFDRVLVRPSEPRALIIRDYKLSRPRIDLDASLIVLWLARLAYPGYDEYRVEWEFVDEGGRVDRETVSVDDVRGMLKDTQNRIKEVILSDQHPAEPGEYCAWCPLREACQPQLLGLNLSSNVFDE